MLQPDLLLQELTSDPKYRFLRKEKCETALSSRKLGCGGSYLGVGPHKGHLAPSWGPTGRGRRLATKGPVDAGRSTAVFPGPCLLSFQPGFKCTLPSISGTQ